MHMIPFMREVGPRFRLCQFENNPKDETSEELNNRLARVRAWLADEEFSEFCNIPAFRNDLTAVAQWVAPESLDDVGWAVLNYWLLPEAEQKEREAIVEQEIANVFGFDGTVVLVGPEPAKLDKIRSFMKAVPNSLLRRNASKMCWSVKAWINMTALQALKDRNKLDDQHGAEILAIYQRLNPYGVFIDTLEFPAHMTSASRTSILSWAFSYGLAYGKVDMLKFATSLIDLSASEQGSEWLLQLADDYERSRSEFGLTAGLVPATLLIVLKLLSMVNSTAAAPRGRAELAALVDEQVRLYEQEDSARHELAVAETFDLLVGDKIKLPPNRRLDRLLILYFVYKQHVRIANDAMKERPPSREHDHSTPPGRGRGGRGRQPKGRGHSQAPQVRLEDSTQSSRSAWRIDQYVEWIEGPVVRKPRLPTNAGAAAQAYNEQTQARHADELRILASLSGDSGSSRQLDKPLAMNTREAERIIQEALSQTLEFIDGSIEDLLALKPALGIEFDPSEFENDRKNLQTLRSQPSMDEFAARAYFHDAWTRIEALRAAIDAERIARPPQLSEQVYRKFKQVFWKALEEEKLALGNHTGGNVLIADDPMKYWARIARELHGRQVILPNARHVIRQDQQRNQALALYVTLGSFTKDVPFCISVHRWRRNPGSTAPRADPTTMIMDEANWTDTLDACCVLHVMSAALASKADRSKSAH